MKIPILIAAGAAFLLVDTLSANDDVQRCYNACYVDADRAMEDCERSRDYAVDDLSAQSFEELNSQDPWDTGSSGSSYGSSASGQPLSGSEQLQQLGDMVMEGLEEQRRIQADSNRRMMSNGYTMARINDEFDRCTSGVRREKQRCESSCRY